MFFMFQMGRKRSKFTLGKDVGKNSEKKNIAREKTRLRNIKFRFKIKETNVATYEQEKKKAKERAKLQTETEREKRRKHGEYKKTCQTIWRLRKQEKRQKKPDDVEIAEVSWEELRECEITKRYSSAHNKLDVNARDVIRCYC